MNKCELFKKKERGDVRDVARIMRVSEANASVILRRPNSKRHQDALKALRLVIEARETAYNKNIEDNNTKND